MKNIALTTLLSLSSCLSQTVHPPVGGVLSEKDMDMSKNRVKNLNALERQQISEWIVQQEDHYFPTSLNYWSTVENLEHRAKQPDGAEVSYEYDLYDFDEVQLYDEPTVRKEVHLGRFQELKAVEHAVRYLKTGEETILLCPSALAFGTYGDNNKIPNDMPVIIHLKVY